MASSCLTTRRSLFAIAGAATVLPAAALAASPSSNLTDLATRWEQALAKAADLSRALARAEIAYNAGLPMPPRLVFTASDAERCRMAGVGGRWPWHEVERVARNAKDWRREPNRYPSRLKWAERLERAVERHKGRIDAWDIQCGYTAANVAWEASLAEIAALEWQMVALSCRSMSDAGIMARVARQNFENDVGLNASKAVCEFVLRQGAH